MKSEPITSVFNDGYIAEQYDAYRRDAGSVEESWRQFFRFAEGLSAGPVSSAEPGFSDDLLRKVGAAATLVDAIRAYGHLAAPIDPLGATAPGTPELLPDFHGLSEADLAVIPGSALGFEDESAGAAIARLRDAYSSTTGFEFDHLGSAAEREWLKTGIEKGDLREPLTPEQKKHLLRRLTEVDALERFLGRAYQGYKRFSIEGSDALVPMLDTVIDRAGAHGAHEVVIGMAHRGRINVLAHTLGKSYATIFDEFEGKHPATNAESVTGDVKYHLGLAGTRTLPDGNAVRVELVPNPSHLEFVNPVVEGVARARQRTGLGTRDEAAVVPVVIHGDAAFPGEGVVAETFNISRLRGFRTGGTIHIIANNQVGFTTDPIDARSTRYASDLAKGFEVPIVHVNADDAEACVRVVELGMSYRAKFGKDFLIDLVGYRRHGHNETDEPSFTQPVLYANIRDHPTPREVWGARLVAEGIVTSDEVAAIEREITANFETIQAGARNQHPDEQSEDEKTAVGSVQQLPETAVRSEQLVALNEQLLVWPSTFNTNSRVAKTLSRRREAMQEAGGIDWGHAEALAFASLLGEGVSIRMTGQDVERGTFSHRQAVLHDTTTGETYTPLQHLPEARASFEIFNSPLSESAVLGFEYGFSTAAPDALVLWEAQFGDFVNVAQPIIDQFMVADRAKWGQDSSLVLLLPHGYEGQGPEHSSARLERFLQSCAQGNMRVAYPSTPAQYFHILRRQAKSADKRPLILMQPKSLLRLPAAASNGSELATGSFRNVIDDAAVTDRAKVTRLVFCTGKIYYDLLERRPEHVAIVRVEELYPWPHREVAAIVDLYPEIEEVVWAQEEPKNMGAWSYVSPQLKVSTGNALIVRYAGRSERASPAEGYADVHKREQERIVADVTAQPARKRRSEAGR